MVLALNWRKLAVYASYAVATCSLAVWCGRLSNENRKLNLEMSRLMESDIVAHGISVVLSTAAREHADWFTASDDIASENYQTFKIPEKLVEGQYIQMGRIRISNGGFVTDSGDTVITLIDSNHDGRIGLPNILNGFAMEVPAGEAIVCIKTGFGLKLYFGENYNGASRK